PIQNCLNQVVKRCPDGVHVGLLALANITIRIVEHLQISREIDAEGLAEDPWCSEEIDQHGPASGRESYFLGQLTLDGRQIALTFHIQQSGRRLDEPVTYRMPILPNQGHPIMIIECDYSDCTRVLQILTGHQFALPCPKLIFPIARDLSLGEHGRGLDRPSERHVDQLVGTENDHRWSSSTGSRVASLRSSAPSTSPPKSGGGRGGRG